MFAASKTASVSAAYQISRSLRFNSADTAYLNRTVASTSNRQTYTFSFWCKLGTISTTRYLYGSSINGNNEFTMGFETTNIFFVYDYQSAYNMNLVTTQLFRDPSAWYHIVVAIDTTQATSSNRVKIYVNGTQVTAFSTSVYPAQNYNTLVNSSSTPDNRIGSLATNLPNYFNGYQTETNFIDGQALTPSSFGETNAQTGVWQPKAYSGSYGTNGFYLNFSDNSNTTAATLGKDYSGNGNNFTPNNFSVTAGAGNDSLVDSPTSYGVDTGVGGEVRGNYCTLNPLFKAGGGTPAYTNGNLDMTAGGTGDSYFAGTTLLTAGKWYYEATITAVGTGGTTILIGACRASDSTTLGNQGCYRSSSEIYNLDGTAQTSGATYAANDVIGVAIDIDAGTVKFYKNNTGQGATNSYTFTAGTALIVRGRSDGANPAATFNFGQRPFAYTAPSGFKALNTQNLPTPTIGATTATQANKYFNVVLRNGAGSAGGTFSTTVNMANGALLWDKTRNLGGDNLLTDSVRGISKYLVSNSTGAEATDVNYVTAFGTNSYTVGSSDWPTDRTVVDWMWAANGTGVTNTSGSVTSTVSANTTSGFSVVTFSGNSTNGTVGHGLGAVPSMFIWRCRNQVEDWLVYHVSLSASNTIRLNTTAASAATSAWQSITPTSSVVYLGAGSTNQTGQNNLLYCFAEVAGYSKFTSWTGNGSADGPFVFTGFRPAYVLVKLSSAAGEGWWVFDNKRNAYNVTNSILSPNSSGAEITGDYGIDMVSNGFKIRNAQGFINSSGATYICAAFAESPFKYALAR